MKKIFVFALALFALCGMLCFNAGAKVYTDETEIPEFDYYSALKECLGELGDDVYFLNESGGKETVVYKKDGVPVIEVYSRWNRCMKRELTEEEYNDFISFINENKIDELENWDSYLVFDGTWYRYMHFTGDYVSYVYINNPGVVEEADDEIYCLLTEKFEKLTKSRDFEVTYNVDGAEVLISNNDTVSVRSVWKNGEDFRIYVLAPENFDYFSRIYKWVSYKDGIIGSEVEAPPGYYNIGENISDEYPKQRNSSLFVRWNDKIVRVTGSEIFLTEENENAVSVREGTYSNPFVAPESDWVICEKSINKSSNTVKLVRVNLITGEEVEFDIPASDSIKPVGVLNGKVLICEGSNRNREFYIYDYANDSLKKVAGDFECFDYIGNRFLQESSVPGKYFALSDQHTAGIFDAETYLFEPVLKTEILIENNDKMWVDEENELIYIVVNSELISLPFVIAHNFNEVKIKLNGKKLLSYPAPYIKNDRAFLPVRAFCEKVGAEVIWNDKTNSVVIIKDDKAVAFKAGEKTFCTVDASQITDAGRFAESVFLSEPELNENEFVFAKKHYFEEESEITGGKFYAPVRAVCEALGMTLEWNGIENTIFVTF